MIFCIYGRSIDLGRARSFRRTPNRDRATSISAFESFVLQWLIWPVINATVMPDIRAPTYLSVRPFRLGFRILVHTVVGDALLGAVAFGAFVDLGMSHV